MRHLRIMLYCVIAFLLYGTAQYKEMYVKPEFTQCVDGVLTVDGVKLERRHHRLAKCKHGLEGK